MVFKHQDPTSHGFWNPMESPLSGLLKRSVGQCRILLFACGLLGPHYRHDSTSRSMWKARQPQQWPQQEGMWAFVVCAGPSRVAPP